MVFFSGNKDGVWGDKMRPKADLRDGPMDWFTERHTMGSYKEGQEKPVITRLLCI